MQNENTPQPLSKEEKIELDGLVKELQPKSVHEIDGLPALMVITDIEEFPKYQKIMERYSELVHKLMEYKKYIKHLAICN